MKRVLPVYPWPMHPKIEAQIRELPDVEPIEAVPGGIGPVLCIRKLPPFMADCILVKEPTGLTAGVRVALGVGLEMVTVRDMLSEVFGAPLIETRDLNLTPAQKAVKFS